MVRGQEPEPWNIQQALLRGKGPSQMTARFGPPPPPYPEYLLNPPPAHASFHKEERIFPVTLQGVATHPRCHLLPP